MQQFLRSLTLLALIITSSFFIGCSSSDGGEEVTPISLVGTWDTQSINFEGDASFEFNGIPLTGTISGEGTDISYQLIFGENPQTFRTAGSFNLAFTFVTLGQTIQDEQEFDAESLIASGSWAQEGNVLIITNAEGESTTLAIEELTENRLVLLALVTQTIFSQEFQTEVVSEGELTIVLTR